LRLHFEPLGPAGVHERTATACAPTEALFVRHRRARRYILRLTPDGQPRVTIPRGGSKREAEQFLLRHADWIARERDRHARHRRHADRAWTTGDRIWIRGVLTPVWISGIDGQRQVRCGLDGLEMQDDADVRSAIERHLKARAARELPQRLRNLAGAHGLTVVRVTIRDQRTRWGSCSPHGAISLNWRLVQMPDSVRDYVLIHELMHLREASHSRRFWRLVHEACPWHVEARRWLRRHGPDLHQPVADVPGCRGALAPQGVDER